MKGQVSLEFMIVVAISLVVFLFMFSITDRRNDEMFASSTNMHAKMQVRGLAEIINNVFLSGEGSKDSYALPDKLRDGTNYSVSVYANYLEINWDSKQYGVPLLTGDVSGNLTYLWNRTVVVSNDGGIVIA